MHILLSFCLKTMQAANRLQKPLKADRPGYGGWQMLPGTNLSRLMFHILEFSQQIPDEGDLLTENNHHKKLHSLKSKTFVVANMD